MQPWCILPEKRAEGEIVAALMQMCDNGHYIEPASAATAAGTGKCLNSEESKGSTVFVLTGHGLKSTEEILKIISNGKDHSIRRKHDGHTKDSDWCSHTFCRALYG
jgi:threonine synthase